jgi:imidazolonepropionase-like amidohydrolase
VLTAALVLSALQSVPPAPAAPAAACDASPLVVRDTSVWTPSGPLAHRDVFVRDGRVVAVRRTARDAPAGMRVVDGAGHTLLPGLVDVHLHFVVPGGLPKGAAPGRQIEITARQLLRSGVTAGRLHLASIDEASRLKARGAAECDVVPRLQVGGPGISGAATTDYPQFWGAKDAADARAKVGRIADAGLDWIAVHDADRFAPDVLDALATTARARGIRLMGASTSPAAIAAVLRIRPETLDYFDRTASADYPPALLAAIRRVPRRVLAPTFGIHHRVAAYAADAARLETEAPFAFVEPAERTFVLDTARAELAKEAGQRALPSIPTKARQLRGLGMTFAIAPDAGSPIHFQDHAIWWDLEAWRALGFTHREALRAATAGGAAGLGWRDVGTLASGSRADFVLYRGDVEAGPFDAGRVLAVAKGGVLFVDQGAWTGR